MRYLIALLMIMVLATSAFAEMDVVKGGMRGQNDTDGLLIMELFTGWEHNYEDGEFIGVEFGNASYDDSDGSDSFQYVRVEGRKNIFKDTYIKGGIRYNTNGSWTPITGDVSLVWENDPIRLEPFFKRSVVESYQGIGDEIMWNTYGVYLDYKLDDTYTLSPNASYVDSSDGNYRTQEGVTLSQKWTEHFYVQYRGRWFQSNFDPEEYWSPESYQKYDVQFVWQKWMYNRMWLRVNAGPGYEIADDESGLVGEYQVILEYDITPSWVFEGYFGGIIVNNDELYQYRWFGALIKYRW